MPKIINATLSFAELKTANGIAVLIPLGLPDVTWVNATEAALADALVQAWGKTWIEQGDYLEVLRALPTNAGWQSHCSVEFKASKDGFRYPCHRHDFPLWCYQLAPDLILGFLPALGIEATGHSQEAVQAAMADNVRLEFVRKGRLGGVRHLVEATWFQAFSWQQVPITLRFYTPAELERLHEHQERPLLPQVASELQPSADLLIALQDELEQLGNALESPFRQNVLLLGANGCGKSALLNAYLKQRRKRRAQPIWETGASRLIQGLSGDSGWQKNLALLCRELREREQILYVNHLHELFEVGQYEGNAVSIGDALREPLQRGEITLIAETTEEELAQLDLRSPGFSALFSRVQIKPCSDAEKMDIIRRASAAMAKRNKVTVDSEAVAEIIRLYRRYFPYSGFPGKTIRFLESLILREKNRADRQPLVDRQQVISGFCQESAMPSALVDEDQILDLETVRDFFRQRLFAQDHAVDTLVDLLAALKTGVLRTDKPIANLLFVGPTGVGKTELAKTLAAYVFGDSKRLLRLDMSEYADPGAVLRITGDLGRGEGSLVSRIRQQPFSVVLLDELEKAHSNFFDLLLQILGEGRLTDGRGQVASFCSAIVIMTSNIGAEGFQRGGIGFHNPHAHTHDVVRHFEQAVQDYFRAELFNRLDRVIPFHPLGADMQPRVIERQLSLLKLRPGLRDREVNLTVDTAAVNFLGRTGYDRRYGARQMQRILQQRLVVPLARRLNAYKCSQPLGLRITAAEQDMQIAVERRDPGRGSGAAVSAERIADLRRRFQAVQEGPVYIGLLSELDQLEAAKRRKDQTFWRSDKRAEKFTRHNRIRRQVEHLFQRILELEAAMTLSLTGMLSEISAGNVAIDTWEADYLELKTQIYLAVHPQAQVCTLGIYGPLPGLSALLQFYQRLCAGFTLQTRIVRLRDEHYVLDEYPLTQAEANKPWKTVGFQLGLSGACPYLLLAGEQGMLRWQTETGKRDDYYLQLFETGEHTPAGVHRRSFFENKQPRRTLRGNKLSDKNYKIEASFSDPSALKDYLQQRFQERLDAVLLGEE